MKKYIAAGVLALIVLVVVIFGVKSCADGRDIDAKGYVQAQLDLTFQGETQEARKYVNVSTSDLRKIYENGINAFTESYLTAGVDTQGTFSDTYGELTKQIFRAMRYRVEDDNKTDKSTYEVKVIYQPADIFPEFLPKLKAVSAEIEEKGKNGGFSGTDEEVSQAMLGEYLNQSYSLLENAYLNMSYGEEEEYTFTLTKEKDGVTMKDEEIAAFIEKILALDKLE